MNKILIADDELIARLRLKHYLKMPTYDISVAKNGSETISLLSKDTYDLLILDMLMPDRDGFEVLNYVKDNKLPVKIIAISGGGHIDANKYLFLARSHKNVIGTIDKPIAKDELIKMIEENL